MTIEEALKAYIGGVAAVTALAGTRGYPGVAPIDADKPNWAYQKVSGPRLAAHDGPTGLAYPRFQFTATGATYSSAKALANAIRAALDGYQGTMGGAGGVLVESCHVVNEMDGYNQASGGSTVRMDVIIWHQE